MQERPENFDEASPQSAELFHLLIENIKDYAIFMTDVEGSVISWNPGVERLLGYRENEIIGQPVSIIFTPEDVAAGVHLKEMEQARKSGFAEDKRWHLRKDGSLFWANGTVMPLKNADGTLRGFAKVMRDETERKLVEENLEQVLSSITDSFYRFDRDFRYTYVNQATTEMFGIAEEDFLGKTLWELFPDVEGNKFHAEVKHALSEQKTMVFENFYAPLDRWFENRVYPSADGLSVFTSEITERKRIEEALRKSEEKYRTLFDSIDEGFCVLEMMFDENDRAIDYRFSEINPSFEKLTGIPAADALRGDGVRKLVPNLEEKWFETYGRVALTGEPVRFIEASTAMNRWFDVYAFRTGEPENRRVALLFNNITDRKAAEEKLHFLVNLNHALQSLSEPDEIMSVTARMLGEHLNVNRCAYAEVAADEDSFRITGDYTRDTFSIVGEFKMSDFGEEALRLMRENQPYVVNDVEHDERAAANLEAYRQTDIAAVISVPLLKNGRFAAGMAVHQKTPRVWTAEEIELVELVVNRCWESIERARVNKNLRESEARFRNMADYAPVMIWITEPDGNCTYLSQSWYEFTGQTPKTGLGFGWLDATHPDDKEAAEKTFIAAGEKREPFRLEYRVRGKDGTYAWAIDSARPRFGTNGEFLGYIGSVFDITERKQAEEELIRSRQFNQDVIDSLPTHIAVVDKDGVITAVNRAWREFAIQNGAEWTMKSVGIGANYLDICQNVSGNDEPDARAICAGLTSVLKREKNSFSFEYPCHSPTEQRWFMLTVAPLTDADGAVISHLNITNRRVAEENLRESEKQFRTLAASIPQLAWMAEADGSIFWYNERWYEYTGTTFEQMQGWGWQSVHDPKVLPQVMTRWRDSIATGEAFEMEFPIKRGSDGAFRWFLTRVLPIRDSEGRVTRWFGTNTDIEEIRQARQTAEEANRLKDEFLATLSHELRTPLNAILGWSQILQNNNLDEIEKAKALATIERSARSQNQLIEDILDVSRIITGKLRLDVRAVDLPTVISAAVDAIRPAAEAKNIRLQILLDPQAGPISGDPDRLQQVVWNLLSNAVKFTPKEGRVQVRLERVNSHVEVVVSDTGKGIEPEFLPYVFDRFRQSDGSMTRRHGGLGLGLAIVRQLVEMHGGAVSVSSDGVNLGAAFTVSLPLLPVRREQTNDLPRVHPTAETGAGIDCPPELADLRILLVDDEADSRDLLNFVLDSCGALVTMASSAAEAFEAYKNEKFDVIVSDIGMPEEDGYSLIRKIRSLTDEQGGNVPAIALTAYAAPKIACRRFVRVFKCTSPNRSNLPN